MRHRVSTSEGTQITEHLVRSLAADTVARLEAEGHPFGKRLESARKVFEEVALSDEFVDFLTLPAYELIN